MEGSDSWQIGALQSIKII